MADTLRTLLDQPTQGIWINCTDPRVVHTAAPGFDWVCVDEQHGYPTFAETGALVGAAAAAGRPSLVRVAWNRPELIGRALDSGATGVIVPMVESAADAAQAVRAARYAPHGRRSFGPIRTPWTARPADLARAEQETICLVMVESPEAVEQVEEIAATPGLDGIFVGPFDLSLALGRDVDEVLADGSAQAPLARIAEACARHGLVAAAYAGSPERATVLRQRGFRMLAVTTDDDLIRLGARVVADQLR